METTVIWCKSTNSWCVILSRGPLSSIYPGAFDPSANGDGLVVVTWHVGLTGGQIPGDGFIYFVRCGCEFPGVDSLPTSESTTLEHHQIAISSVLISCLQVTIATILVLRCSFRYFDIVNSYIAIYTAIYAFWGYALRRESSSDVARNREAFFLAVFWRHSEGGEFFYLCRCHFEEETLALWFYL